ncbi:23S rRNA pseudouridine(1911/1915/1917) synthase RluD [Beggiatoa leptomitoformis]|uniref:Pseudouridine synthase n=1 Tax=Beggiatoa leptomitoformis TaxID=288004 RepID=A0A2N9YJH7_9GAMM|nr:23S rRNA pseudouridine(1911/1915/1917) synthase RluD [Beggiatoa leptomitoformis]ALG69395.1 23S rRNA pseudouridine(1911/1915/1917) synthase RluD [Beggiatoa leptomitoformis]AUI70677.1 23S rRNA pseudouridine(1911/1915/1917) synthase RluD [Beggiatoa leptomitoformis]
MVNTHFSTKIPDEMSGWRLDKALAELFPDYSRARLQKWIKDGFVLVNAMPLRGKDKVQGGEDIEIIAQAEEEVTWEGQDLPILKILYEDDDIIVVDKEAGVVVHPGAGNPDSTLVNALLNHAPELVQLPRAGIIHRIDKDTSGILVVARSLPAHTSLVAQLQAREFKREYQAIVNGMMISGGTVDAPMDRHPIHRTRMAVVERGKPAVTHYRVIRRFRLHTLIRASLETGRTHQIRVHLAHAHYPLVGDPVYGGRLHLPPACTEDLQVALRQFKRQALHAERLGFIHPTQKEYMEWQVPIPADMQQLLKLLATDQQLFEAKKQ